MNSNRMVLFRVTATLFILVNHRWRVFLLIIVIIVFKLLLNMVYIVIIYIVVIVIIVSVSIILLRIWLFHHNTRLEILLIQLDNNLWGISNIIVVIHQLSHFIIFFITIIAFRRVSLFDSDRSSSLFVFVTLWGWWY